MARHLTGGTAATAEMFADLFRLASRFELAIPPEIATVLRALATLEGALSLLTAGFDIAAEARQYAAGYMAGQVSPRAMQKTAADELIALLPVLRRLPRRLDRITSTKTAPNAVGPSDPLLGCFRSGGCRLAAGGLRLVLWLRAKGGLGALLVILAPVKIRKHQLSGYGGWPARQDHG